MAFVYITQNSWLIRWGVGALLGIFELLQIKKRKDARNFIILAPHCKGVTWSEWMDPLLHLIEQFRQLPYVDETRIHLTGNSMGGFATWTLATLRPDWFASAMPIAGGANGFTKRLTEIGQPFFFCYLFVL